MTKVYNSKSNAVRAFRTHFADVAAQLTNDQIRTDYLDEEDGGWVLIDPAICAENDAAEQARADAEYEERQQVEARIVEQKACEDAIIAGKTADLTTLGEDGIDGRCPHCGIHLSNGVQDYASVCEHSKSEAGKMKHNFYCMGCNGEFGPLVVRKTHVETDRTVKVRSTLSNPVKFMWDMLDAEPDLIRKEAVARGIAAGVSPNTAATQFQWWRKARGLVQAK